MPTQLPNPQPLGRPVRLAVLISGGGSTMVNLDEQIRAGLLDAEIVTVVASRPDCGGIGKARDRSLPIEIVSRNSFESTPAFSEAVFRQVQQANADLVVLAGFLSLIVIPDSYMLRVMNIHPSLIPAFCGRGFHGSKVHEAVLARGARITGCTVHFADNEYDHGPIIWQEAVPVLDGDTAVDIAQRVGVAEHKAYPAAIRLFAEGRLQVFGQRVIHLPPRE